MKSSMIARLPVWIGASLALLAISGAARAQSDSGFYVGAGVGRSTFETRQLTASLPPQRVLVKDTSSAVRVFGGYRAMRFIFIEAGTTSYGNFTEALGDDQSFEASYGGWDASLILNAPVSDSFDIFARVGVARSKYDSVITDAVDPGFGVDSKESESQKSSILGVGAQINLGAERNFGIRLEYNTYDVSLLAVDQSNVLASFVYRFNR